MHGKAYSHMLYLTPSVLFRLTRSAFHLSMEESKVSYLYLYIYLLDKVSYLYLSIYLLKKPLICLCMGPEAYLEEGLCLGRRLGEGSHAAKAHAHLLHHPLAVDRREAEVHAAGHDRDVVLTTAGLRRGGVRGRGGERRGRGVEE